MREISYSNVPPMMAAIQSGDIEALRSLLHAGYPFFNRRTGYTKFFGSFFACMPFQHILNNR